MRLLLKARIAAIVLWTVLLAASLAWNVREDRNHAFETLLAQARAVIAKDALLLHWVSQAGGVYVPVGPAAEPNPLLKSLPERDIATPSGRRLTYFDASYMLRRIGELGARQGLEDMARLRSLKPLRHENAPDPWEAEALKSLEAGAAEASCMGLVDGRRHLRLMKPMRVEQGCLSCHSPREHKKGDLLGGISVSLPAGGMDASTRRHQAFETAAHALLWLLGLAGIAYAGSRLSRSEESRRAAEEQALRSLEMHRDTLEAEVSVRTRELVGSNERLGKESEARLRGERVTRSLNRLLNLALADEPLETTLQRCLEEILSIEGLSIQAKGAVFLADRKSRTLRMAAEKGLSGPIKSACASLAFGKCFCGRAAATGETQYASALDERHETRYEGILPHGHYAVSIMLSGEAAGVMVLYLDEGHPHCEDEAGFLKAAADVVAGIVRHKREERKTRMLAEVAFAVSMAGDSREALRSVLAAVCSGMNWLCGDAWLPSEDGAALEFAASWSAGGPDIDAFREESAKHSFKPGEGLPGRVFYSKAPLIIDDVALDANFPRAGLAGKTGVRSAMGVPVTAGDEAAAILAFYAPASAIFTQDDADVAAVVAAQVAPLILRRRAEDRLKHSQRSLAEAQRIAGVGSWERGPADRRILWSDELHKIMGVPLAESVSFETFLASVHPDEKDMVQKSMIEALERGRDFDVVRRALRPDGSVVWVRDIGTVVRDAEGKPVKFRGTVQDVTARKALEERLGQAQKMEAVGQLAGGVAHDFNNLLTSILGYAEFLLGSLKPDDPGRADVEEIRQAGQRAAALTRQLLAFSRKQPVSPEEVDLNALVLNLGKMLKRLLGERVETVLDLAPSLPRVFVDPGQMEQVVMNLAVNGRDAMPKGGRLVISTREEVSGPRVTLAVKDTGVGMDEAVRARLFEPFFTTKEKGKGTGLGLSIVYAAVQQAGGSIGVESAPGRGAVFTISLPALAESRAQSEAEPKPAAAAGGSELVLLVEDEEAVRKTAARMLGAMGYEALQAAGAAEAMSLAERRGGEIRLVLTDVAMPGKTGVELASELARRGLKAKVLFMTGYADRTLPAFKGLGRDLPVIQKPFTQDELGRRVREILDS
ncbi:MAG: GAF domain-containing protein [Elusimicrobia bacterium]|nr:GAF domain-containing protein [Elusimicrobiota bacterium]